ncbi:protein NO VEIN domain-containing protein, partial [Methylosinus sp. R-45379]|uniref:protein NO VEIN domain-containing protein n=1 Tax=Methylosinus sp. R-45379 TaxID=980563 RepID=UPI000B240B89
MVKFVAIKINYDDRTLAAESKYAVPVDKIDYQRFIDRFENDKVGGYGFHECLNFQIKTGGPVQAYLPPTGLPKDTNSEYVIFSFTYRGDHLVPSAVLGVHGGARIISKEGISRPGASPISGVGELTYHLEAEPELVTLFSSPLDYDPLGNRYTINYKKWGNGLRYITSEFAANILNDALIKAYSDLNNGSESYKHFVERGIKVINQIISQYGLRGSSLDNKGWSSHGGRIGGSLPDKLLGEKGERLIYEREREFAIEQGFSPDKVSWAAQVVPSLPYDIETIRRTPDGSRSHFIEVKSTTLDELTNIYISSYQIEHMK